MPEIKNITDKEAELTNGGAGSNIPNGFFNTTTGEFSNGVYKRTQNAGGYDSVTYIPGGEMLAYTRVLPNGKQLDWG